MASPENDPVEVARRIKKIVDAMKIEQAAKPNATGLKPELNTLAHYLTLTHSQPRKLAKDRKILATGTTSDLLVSLTRDDKRRRDEIIGVFPIQQLPIELQMTVSLLTYSTFKHLTLYRQV